MSKKNRFLYACKVNEKDYVSFLEKYLKGERFPEDRVLFLYQKKKELLDNGYLFISHVDSTTGKAVSFFGAV